MDKYLDAKMARTNNSTSEEIKITNNKRPATLAFQTNFLAFSWSHFD
ncbi:MAG: hypothetical protein ACPGYY_07420 [Bacteroidia bacterium]